MNATPSLLRGVAGVALMAAATAWAQQSATPADHDAHHPAAAAAAAPATELSEGEVRRIDAANGKVTLRHGEIRNLDMPAMTMVFQVSDPALLAQVKVGDKVRFRAEQVEGSYRVTTLQPAP